VNKRAYFFILDAFIGGAVIFLTLMILLNSDNTINQRAREFSEADEYLNFLDQTQIQDLNNPYVNTLILGGNISDTKNTIIEQIHYFHYMIYEGCATQACKNYYNDTARTMLANITQGLVAEKYGFDYLIKDSEANYSIFSKKLNELTKARTVLVARRIAFVPINKTRIYGPNIVEVKVWY